MSINRMGSASTLRGTTGPTSTWISMHEPIGQRIDTRRPRSTQAWAWSNESLWLDLNISHPVNGAHAEDRSAALYLLGSGPDDSIGSGAVSVPYLPTFSSGDAYLNLTYLSDGHCTTGPCEPYTILEPSGRTSRPMGASEVTPRPPSPSMHSQKEMHRCTRRDRPLDGGPGPRRGPRRR